MKKILFSTICLLLYTTTVSPSLENTTLIIKEDFHKKGMIKVRGIGYPPSRISDKRQARLLARRAAIVDGYRNLLKSLDNISSWIENKNVIERESGFLKGAKILATRYLENGKVEVDLGLDITLKPGRLEKIEKYGYEVIYVTEITQEPYEVITKKEWMELISERR